MNFNKYICDWINTKFYPNFSERWDDKIFAEKVLQFLRPNFILLDIGAGKGNVFLNFLGKCTKVCGIDPEPEVLQNPFLNEAKIGKGEDIPFPAEYFDIIISANTLEHVENPQKLFLEAKRVLKRNGLFLLKTSNAMHYVSIVARMTPLSVHKKWNKLRDVEESDTFLKHFKVNTLSKMKKIATSSGYKIIQIETYEGRPEYMKVFWPFYIMGLIYERIVNRVQFLRNFRSVIIGVFSKSMESDQ